MLGPTDDLATLVATAVDEGADALGMAGGDGSLATVAAAAAGRDLPFVCLPAGTRNHFALDLGIVRHDLIGALDAFTEALERRIDIAEDAAELSMDDILSPRGWILLSFLMDPRTGLGRFRNFRISNYQLMMQLIDSCLDLSIDEILASPDVAERVALYNEHSEAAIGQILRCSTVHDRVVVLDLRDEEVIHPTNRFLVYALHPQCTVSIHVLWGLRQQNTVFAVGRSILDRSSRVDIGALMLAHGGGGHEAAGTCQVDNDRAETVLADLVQTIIDGEREPVAG